MEIHKCNMCGCDPVFLDTVVEEECFGEFGIVSNEIHCKCNINQAIRYNYLINLKPLNKNGSLSRKFKKRLNSELPMVKELLVSKWNEMNMVYKERDTIAVEARQVESSMTRRRL